MIDGDIKTYKALVNTSDNTNGGRRSDTLVQSGEVQNVMPHVSKGMRAAGGTLQRKLFTGGATATPETLIAALLRLFRPTAGDDWATIFTDSVDKTNTQADWAPSREYGSALLKTDIEADAFTATFTVDDATITGIFAAGDETVITEKLTPDAASGSEETIIIDSIDSIVGNDVTITFTTAFVNSYTVAGGAFLMSVIPIGDTLCSTGAYTETTAGTGTYDDGSYPITCDNRGTVEDILTFDFTDATHFTCTGSSGITYGSGERGVDFSPTNAAKSAPYFTLEAGGWIGIWAGGDKLVVPIHDCYFPYVVKRVVPVACASLSGNLITAVVEAESES